MSKPMMKQLQHAASKKKFCVSTLVYAVVLGCTGLALSGCGASDDRKESASSHDGHGHNHDHKHDHEVSDKVKKEVAKGRLIITDKVAKKAYVYSLAQKKVVQTLAITHAGSDVHASPEKRFAVVKSRKNHHTGFISSGLRVEDHGDHDHPYADAAKVSPLKLSYAKPTHYQINEGVGAMFFDGDGNDGNPLKEFKQAAGFALFIDEQIAKNKQPAYFKLPNNMHGTAEPRFSKTQGNFVLTTQRVKTKVSPLADKIALYEVNGNKIKPKQVFTPDCPRLHGSASNKDYSVFACGDSVVSIKQQGKSFTAKRIAHAEQLKEIVCKNNKGKARSVRIGSFKAHEKVSEFIGNACGQPVLVNLATESLKPLNWNTDKTAAVKHYLYSQDGKTLLLLDNKGKLHFVDVQNNYRNKGAITLFTKGIHTKGHGGPKLILNDGDTAFVLNGHDKEIYEIDITDQKKVNTIKLNFAAKSLVWVGSGKDTHEHSH